MKKVLALTTAIGIALAAITGVTSASPAEAAVDSSVPSVIVPLADPTPTLWPLYKTHFDWTIYELVTTNGVRTTVPVSYEKYRDVYKSGPYTIAPTSFVKYPWSPTIYGVTFVPGGESAWPWTEISYFKFRTGLYKPVLNAGWIKGSYYYKWGTSQEIFVEGADGVNHKLAYAEWRDSGFRPFASRSNEGFRKLSWASEIVRSNDLAGGGGGAIAYAEWEAEGFPTPQVVNRMPGDDFYRYAGDPTVWYDGPGIHRPITFAEWTAAGSPAPTLEATRIGGNAGLLRVGSDVAPGSYVSYGGPNCYFARLSGSDRENDVIEDEWATAVKVITIESSDAYFFTGGDADIADPGCGYWSPVTFD